MNSLYAHETEPGPLTAGLSFGGYRLTRDRARVKINY
jgi:hypothetical protein